SDVCLGLLGAVKMLIEILGFQQRACSSLALSELHPGDTPLVSDLGCVENNVDFAGIPKVGTVACAIEHVHGYLLCLVGCMVSVCFQLDVENGSKFVLREVLESETGRHWEATTETGVDIPEHLLHLVLVSQKKHAAVVARYALDFGDNGIDHRRF